MSIGIDFGTTFSKIAHVETTGKSVIINNARGDSTTPTAVHRSDDGSILIGKDAIEQGAVDPKGLVRSFKLKLGQHENLLDRGEPFTPTDAATTFLQAFLADAEKQIGTKVEEAVVTCPANFRDDAKQALLDSFEACGVEVLRLVPEPTAAGIVYALDKAPEGSNVLIYDSGGGTFDTTVLKKEGSDIHVRATEGVARLGGNDLTQILVERVLDEIEEETGQRPDPEEEQLFFLDLWQRCETAKLSLGRQTKAPIIASWHGKQHIVNVTQDEFHADATPLVDQTLACIDAAVSSAGLSIEQIDRLIMVGGTSRLPLIQERVAEHTKLVPRCEIDPSNAIAYGAAQASLIEMSKLGKTASLRGVAIPAPAVFVRDVTAHGVGCCIVDKQSSESRLANAVIIEPNTPIPCTKADHFALEHDDQRQAQVEILQGSDDANRDDCLVIGELRLDDLPPEPVSSKRITVEYAIDANGMVQATATDKVSGKTATVSVDYAKGISKAG